MAKKRETTATEGDDGFDVPAPPVTAFEAQKNARVAEMLRTAEVATPDPKVDAAPDKPDQDAQALALKQLEVKLAGFGGNYMRGHDLTKELTAQFSRATTRVEQRIIKALVQRTKQWTFAVQQGVASPRIGADDLAVQPGGAGAIREVRVELRARKDRDVAALLKANAALRKQLAGMETVKE